MSAAQDRQELKQRLIVMRKQSDDDLELKTLCRDALDTICNLERGAAEALTFLKAAHNSLKGGD